MGCLQNGYDPINQYALVSYIPDPLGEFLDRLRVRLAPECRPHAHVTVLPPRPLQGPVEVAESELREATSQFQPFEIQLGDVEMFASTKVIYIEVERGEAELRRMHRKLNCGAVLFEEPYDFHPHITLAQSLPPEGVLDSLSLARELWSEWKDNRTFPVDQLSFVQNTQQNIWIDLMHVRLDQQLAGIR